MKASFFKRVTAFALMGALCATQAMAVDVDLSSPKAAVTTLAKAMHEGDAAAARAVIDGDEQQLKAIDAMIQMISSMQAMEKAANEKFGAEATEDTRTELAQVVQQTANAQEQINGDTAMVTVPAPAGPDQDPATAGPAQQIPLRKVGNDWKVDAQALMQGQTPTDKQLGALRAMAQAAQSVAQEIRDGKFADYASAREAYQQRMFAAIMQAVPQQGAQPAPVPAE